MDTSGAIRKGSSLLGMPVTTPGGGLKFGVVEDFYFKEGTNALDSFLVNRGLQGYSSLPITAIKTVEPDAVIVDTAQAFINALPPFPTGKKLLTYKVVGESGEAVGNVGEILLAVIPPVAMRIAGIELKNSNGRQGKRFSADDIIHYRQNMVVLTDQDAKKLR